MNAQWRNRGLQVFPESVARVQRADLLDNRTFPSRLADLKRANSGSFHFIDAK
jgi:hypothetical protein